MIRIVTLTDQGYQRKIRRYLETLEKHGGPAMRHVGLVGCEALPWLLEGLPSVQPFTVPLVMLAPELGNPGNGCIQHGNFLPYLPGGLDDVLIVTDGDVRMQREFTAEERETLNWWPPGVIGIGPNAGPDDDLVSEARRLRPMVPISQLADLWGGGRAPPCGNAGVIVARRSTWLAFWAAYLSAFLETRPLFRHIAVQQWTINLVIARHFTRAVLPLSFHLHGHYGIPDFCDGWASGPDDNSRACYKGRLVLFAHRTW